jgi:glycosyltransferase involved in cell wall biosynthesis
MRVVLIGSFADSLINFRGDLLREMVADGHQVWAAAPLAGEHTSKSLALIGAQYRAYTLDRAGLNPLADVRAFLDLFRLVRDARPDCVLTYTAKPVILGWLATRLTGNGKSFPMITGLGYAFTSTTFKARAARYILLKLYRRALKSARCVFFQNPADRDCLSTAGVLDPSTRVVVIPGSGVNCRHFESYPLYPHPRFLMIARLLRDKGVYEYVEAARTVKVRHPAAEFWLIGAPDENPTSVTMKEIEAWEREGVIRFHGWLDDVRPALRDSRFYVLPSYREGMPRTVLEAMSMGRPVIATDVPGCQHAVSAGETGVLVPPRDAGALAKAMEFLILHPELAEQMGRQGRARAEREFDVRIVNDLILRAMGLRS